jgi:hypothetical protein
MQQIYHDPREPHLIAMKCIMCYLQGMPDYGLPLHHSSSSDLVVCTEAEWVSCPDTHRSTSGYGCSWGTTWYPGQPRGRPLSPAPAPRPSIASLPMVCLRPLGCISCFMSSRPRRLGAPLSTMIISAPCTYPPTPFSINTLSMWRLIFILFKRRLPSVMFASSMSRRHRSLLTAGFSLFKS